MKPILKVNKVEASFFCQGENLGLEFPVSDLPPRIRERVEKLVSDGRTRIRFSIRLGSRRRLLPARVSVSSIFLGA